MDSEEEMQNMRHTHSLPPLSKVDFRTLFSHGLGCALIGVAGSASALSLGGLNVMSSPGQPIRGEIEVIEDRPGEAEGVGLSIATPEQYQAMGLQFNPVINSLVFDAYRRVDNRVFLKITSAQPVNVPYFDLLLVAATPTGEMRRQYTFYIGDAANTGRASNSAPANVTSPAVLPSSTPAQAPRPAPITQSPTPSTNTPAPTPSQSGVQFSSSDPRPAAARQAGGGLLVQQGQSLSRIARENAYDGVSLEQMMAALYYSNPNAFINKNINLIKAGANLKLPSQSEVAGVTPGKARQLVRAHSRDFNQYRRSLSAIASGSAVKVNDRGQAQAIKAQVSDASQRTVTGDRVELSKGTAVKPSGASSQTAAEEQKIAQALENKEKADKAAALQKDIDALKGAQGQISPGTPDGSASAGAQPLPSLESNTAVNKAGGADASNSLSWQERLAQIWNKFKWWIIGGLGALLALLFLSRRSKNAEEDYYGNLGKESVLDEREEREQNMHEEGYVADEAEVSANPLHEAGVYMNYGRYLEAQRVLESATENGYPDEVGIKLMLAEIHSRTLDRKEFDKVSEQLHTLTGGTGHQWAKVQELALAFDPATASHEFSSDTELDARSTPEADEDGYIRGLPDDHVRPVAPPEERMQKLADEMDSAIAQHADTSDSLRQESVQAAVQDSGLNARDLDHAIAQAAKSVPTDVIGASAGSSTRIAPAFTQEQYNDSFDLSALSLDLGDHSEAGLRVDSGVKPTMSAPASQTSLAFDKLMRAEALKSQGDIGGAKHLVEELLTMDLGNLTDSVKRLQRSLDA